jgi:hypothetical protein
MECKEQQRRLDICAPEGGNMGVTRNLGVNTSNKEAGIYIVQFDPQYIMAVLR